MKALGIDITQRELQQWDGREKIIFTCSPEQSKSFSNEIEVLIYCTNISTIGVGIICFLTEVEQLEDLDIFAVLDFQHSIGLRNEDKVIYFCVEESPPIWFAKTESDFLAFLAAYQKLHYLFIYHKKYGHETREKILGCPNLNNKVVDFFLESMPISECLPSSPS